MRVPGSKLVTGLGVAKVLCARAGPKEDAVDVTGAGVGAGPEHVPAGPATAEEAPVYVMMSTWWAPSSVTSRRLHESNRTSTGRTPLGHFAWLPAWHIKSAGSR